jgi:hypothetical protein
MKTTQSNFISLHSTPSRRAFPRSRKALPGWLWTAVLLGLGISVSAQIYSPPTAGLVGWWRGENNGNDSSGNGHNGTLGSTVNFGPGISGQAFSFQGGLGSGRVYVPDSPDFQLTSSLSIAAWINLSQPQATGAILMRGDNNAGLDPYIFGLSSAGTLDFVVESTGPYTELISPNALPLNQWVQVTATLDGSTGDMRIYVNGILDSETYTTVRPFADLDPYQDPSIGIGNASGTLYNFPLVGLEDEVLLYSRALTPDEVAALAVPEPASLALLGVGAAGLLLFRQRA